MQVKDAMNPRVVVAKPDTSIREAAKTMTRFRIGSLVVLEKNKIAGIVTERDIMMNVVAEGKDTETTKINDIMTKKVIIIKPEQSLEEASGVMVEHEIKKLPVLDNDKLVGILTASDIVAIEPKLIEAIAKLLLFKEKKPVAG